MRVDHRNTAVTIQYRTDREVCVLTHDTLCMFIMQVLASQLHFLANRNAELAVPPLFWPVNCLKIGRHVPLLSYPSIYFNGHSVDRNHFNYNVSTNLQSSSGTFDDD